MSESPNEPDPAAHVLEIDTWDGAGGSPSVIYIEQDEEAEQDVHGDK